jgi:hypothetical protein
MNQHSPSQQQHHVGWMMYEQETTFSLYSHRIIKTAMVTYVLTIHMHLYPLSNHQVPCLLIYIIMGPYCKQYKSTTDFFISLLKALNPQSIHLFLSKDGWCPRDILDGQMGSQEKKEASNTFVLLCACTSWMGKWAVKKRKKQAILLYYCVHALLKTLCWFDVFPE